MAEPKADSYTDLIAGIASLSEGDKNAVLRQMALAQGYGWGWQDGKGETSDSNQVWNFHIAYGWHALQYERSEVCYRLSVTTAWTKFLRGESF